MDHTAVALIEWLDGHGQVQRTSPVYGWPCVLGRAVRADVHLDDPCTAAEHAVLSLDDQGVRLTVGDTVNGVLLGDRHLSRGESAVMGAGQTCRLGHLRLRVRLPHEALAPERPLGRAALQAAALHERAPAPGWAAWLVWAVVAVAWSVLDMWLAAEPATPVRTYLSGVLATAGVVGVWALLWSLGSKLFQGRLQFHAHMRLALVHGVAWTAVTTILPMLSYMSGWAWPELVSGWVGGAVIARLVWAHLCVIQPALRMPMGAGVTAAFLTGLGLMMWLNVQSQGRVWSQPYAATMLPPAWLHAPLAAPERLLDDAAALKAELDERARKDDEDEGGPSDDEFADDDDMAD